MNDYSATFDEAWIVKIQVVMLKTKILELTQKLANLEAEVDILSELPLVQMRK